MGDPAPAPPAPATSTLLTKVGLRRKGVTLQAVRVQAVTHVTMPEGMDRVAHPGDWLIYQGAYLLALCPEADFPGPTYEIVAEGTLTLTVQDRDLLERSAGIGCTQSAASLIHAVQRLARIQIGDVTIPFTPGQLEELKHRADKRGQTIEQTVQAVITRIKDELFWRG